MMDKQQNKKSCDTCGGSGEIGFFQGESRFFITRDECPACCGLGYPLDEGEDSAGGPDSTATQPSPQKNPNQGRGERDNG